MLRAHPPEVDLLLAFPVSALGFAFFVPVHPIRFDWVSENVDAQSIRRLLG